MSDDTNPYQSPAANTEVVQPLIAQGILTENMVKNLSDASPWLRFLGIMGFIGSGLSIMGGLVSLVVMPLVSRIMQQPLDYYSISLSSFNPALIYSLYFIVAGLIMFFPALFSYRFGSRIRAYTQTNSGQDLELAFKNNKLLCKFNGILMIIGLAVLPVIIIVGIVALVANLAFN